MQDTTTYSPPIAPEDAARVLEQLDRVAREEREPREARLHHRLHGSWLSRDECATCLDERQ